MTDRDHIPLFQTKSIECVDCGVTFDWTAEEQRFYWSKELSEPKRCPSCRRIRKSTIARRWQNG